jgi:beta-glucosidase-like glycosyl hydrolase
MITTAKHFPGHGDTDTDSHLSLPRMAHDLERLEKVELPPFKSLIDKGVDAIMSAHIYIPKTEPTPNLPCTLSPRVMTGLLKEKLGFKGLVMTDSLTMKGITLHYTIPEASVRSLQAGNHLLLYADGTPQERELIVKKHVPESIKAIKDALKKGALREEQLDEAVRAVLSLKDKIRGNASESLRSIDQINTKEALELKKNLYSLAVTLVKNHSGLLPLRDGQTRKNTLALVLNNPAGDVSAFSKTLLEGGVLSRNVTLSSGNINFSDLEECARGYDILVLGVYDVGLRTDAQRKALETLRELSKRFLTQGKKVVVVIFGTPYSLPYFMDEDAVVMAYEEDSDAEAAVAKIILGGLNPSGRLPVTACPEYPRGQGLSF